MSDLPRKFKVSYRDPSTFNLITETPRLAITADGKHKSLIVGDSTVLASVATDESDAVLWGLARESSVLNQ